MAKALTTPAGDDAMDLARLRRSPTHPGLMLAQCLSVSGVSPVEAAQRMSMSVTRLNDVREGKRAMTPEACVQVGALTNTRPEFWGGLQMRYDVWHAMQEHAAAVKTIAPIAPGPSPQMPAPVT